MKLVAQWKNYKWVNFYDEDGNARYFKNVKEASDFLKATHFSRTNVEVRICEYNGGWNYTEIVAPKLLKEYK